MMKRTRLADDIRHLLGPAGAQTVTITLDAEAARQVAQACEYFEGVGMKRITGYAVKGSAE